MNKRLVLTTAAAVTAAIVPAASAAPGDVIRASVTDAGAQSTTGGVRGVVSGDGRFVIFVSAENLAGVPTGGKLQLYRRDLRDGRTQLVSTAAGGAVANENVEAGDPFNPFTDVTPDGRYVVFRSAATNLVGTDTNAQPDVFRKDMVTGEVTLVSVSSAGVQANNFSSDPSISGDGARIVFVSAATNLVSPDGNAAASDIFLRDLAAGTTTLVSTNGAGQQANDFTERPSISADGNVVAFEAGPLTTNLYPNDSNASNDIIVKNLATGQAVPAAVVTTATTLEGADVKGGNAPDISGDGRYVTFQTGAVLDATNDTTATDVYVRDVTGGTTVLASAINGVAGSGGGSTGTISADGARVGFISDGTTLVGGDTNATADAFARTLTSRATMRMSQLADGTQANLGWETAGLSGNGARGVYTGQGVFSAADSNAADDVYATELTPTDAAGPALIATGAPGPVGRVRVTGTVTDTSGIARLTVGGLAVRPGAGGAFQVDIPTALSATVEALDGAGNLSSATVTFTKTPRVTALNVIVTRRTLVARWTLNERARVVTLLQRAVRTRSGAVRWVQVGRPKIATFNAGRRQAGFARPNRPGAYRIRVVATNSAGRHAVNRGFALRRLP